MCLSYRLYIICIRVYVYIYIYTCILTINLCSPKPRPSFPHSSGLAMHPPQPAVEGFLQLDDVLLPVGDLNLLVLFKISNIVLMAFVLKGKNHNT